MNKAALIHFKTEDVRLAVRHPDQNVRAVATQRICREIRDNALSKGEKDFATRLLKHIAKDSAELVRRALAVTLKNSPKLPRNIAVSLAKDIESIAVPVLTHSPVFSDEDLIQILKSRAAAKVLAVAKRVSVSDIVARAIIRFGDSHAIAEVAANDGALISEETATEMLDIYNDTDLIGQNIMARGIIARRDLPPKVVEKMITLVSEDVAIKLVKHHSVSAKAAIDLASRTRERAVLDFVDQSWVSKDLTALIEAIDAQGRLTDSLIIRAAGSGQIRFVEQGLAKLANVSLRKAILMIHDGGPFGLKSLCKRAGMSENSTHIIRASCVIYRDLEMSGMIYDRNHFQQRMIERVLTLSFDMAVDEETWFLEMLNGLSETQTGGA